MGLLKFENNKYFHVGIIALRQSKHEVNEFKISGTRVGIEGF
jgi:hypothetical protein